MQKNRVLVLGKRGGILQWYENILDIETQNENFEIFGFALNHNHFKERAVKFFLKQSKSKFAYNNYTSKQLKKKLDQIQPTHILIVDLFYFDQTILDQLKYAKENYDSKVFHWIGDFFDNRLKIAAPYIDHYYFTDSTFINDAKNIGINHTSYLPLATNPNIFKQTIPFEEKQDCLLFIGAYSKSREDIIKNIHYPMTIIGKGWGKFQPEYNDIRIIPKNISIKDVAKYYDQHKFIFNAINKNNTRQGLTMRCFDVQICGSILITEYSEDLKLCTSLKFESFKSPADILPILKNGLQPAIKSTTKKENNSYLERIQHILN